jgi:four helix bundle protein
VRREEWGGGRSRRYARESNLMAIQSYQELKVWQKRMDLAVLCYQATKAFPKEERYYLTSQIRRAPTSIPANIAEGQGRQHTKEFLQFLYIARGSLKELETHLILSPRVGLLFEKDLQQLLALTEELRRMFASLRSALEARL